MKTISMAVLAVLITVFPAEAISRYNSTSLSCQAAKSHVVNEGAVIFRYPSSRNPSLILYDRFVVHGGYCSHGEHAAAKSIPTASGNCALLYCRQRNHGFGFQFRNKGIFD